MFACQCVNNVSVKYFERFSVVLILTVVLVGVLAYFMPKSFDSFCGDLSPQATVAIYCRQTQLDSIDMGSGRIVSCDANDFLETLAKCDGVDGVSVSFSGTDDDVQRLISFFRLDTLSSNLLDDLTVICGHSAKIQGGVWIDGQLVNLQIAYRNGTVTVGSPLILGSY